MGNTNNANNPYNRRGGGAAASGDRTGSKKCTTLKNHANIRKESIKIVRTRDGTNQHELEMMFDTNYECLITVYLCATEIRNA